MSLAPVRAAHPRRTAFEERESQYDASRADGDRRSRSIEDEERRRPSRRRSRAKDCRRAFACVTRRTTRRVARRTRHCERVREIPAGGDQSRRTTISPMLGRIRTSRFAELGVIELLTRAAVAHRISIIQPSFGGCAPRTAPPRDPVPVCMSDVRRDSLRCDMRSATAEHRLMRSR